MTKIYCFSGTGNSLWSAKKIKEAIGGESEIINIGSEVSKSEIKIEADTVIFVFPSYAYGLPMAVHRFAKKAEIKAGYIAAFVTYGTSPRGTLGELSRILKKKYSGPSYFGRIPAVENYIAIFGPPSEKTLERRLAMQKEATEEAVRAVIEKRKNSVSTWSPFSSFVSALFSLGVKVFYNFYRVSGDCNGCEICAKICPVSAITMKDGRPVFSGKCEHCQACINLCPVRAILFGRIKASMPTYHHPEISSSDLVR